MDDDKPVTWRAALLTVEFWLLLAVALASTVGLGWWLVLPLAVAGLSLSSVPKYLRLWPLARQVDADGAWWSAVALSVFNDLGVSVAAFLLGQVLRWVSI